jgi:hypothetical protein
MYSRIVLMCSLAVAIAGCSAVGQLTVKDYKSRSGARVLAGQSEPKAEYNCAKISQEPQEWGIVGNMNRVSATQRVTTAAVDSAPARGANTALPVQLPDRRAKSDLATTRGHSCRLSIVINLTSPPTSSLRSWGFRAFS